LSKAKKHHDQSIGACRTRTGSGNHGTCFLMGIAIFVWKWNHMQSYTILSGVWFHICSWFLFGIAVIWLWNGCVFLWFVNPKWDWWLWFFFYWTCFKSTLEWILDDTILRVEISGCSQHAGYWRQTVVEYGCMTRKLCRNWVQRWIGRDVTGLLSDFPFSGALCTTYSRHLSQFYDCPNWKVLNIWVLFLV
jgi:hypothetical protein